MCLTDSKLKIKLLTSTADAETWHEYVDSSSGESHTWKWALIPAQCEIDKITILAQIRLVFQDGMSAAFLTVANVQHSYVCAALYKRVRFCIKCSLIRSSYDKHNNVFMGTNLQYQFYGMLSFRALCENGSLK